MSKILTKWLADDAVDKTKIAADVAGIGLGQNVDGSLEVNVDDDTLEVATDTLQIKALGVDTPEINSTSVTAAKLGSDVAGDGLTGGNGSAIDVKPDAVGGANLSRSVNVDATNGVAVKIDGSTISENGSQQLAVPTDGIGPTQLDMTANYTLTGTIDASGATSCSVPTPTNDGHAATKGYIDSMVEGRPPKDASRALANTDQTISGLPSNIDGVTGWSNGEQVLLTNQGTGAENGLWLVDASAWSRPDNFDTGASVAGASTWINEGTTYGDTEWTCSNDGGSDVVDTDTLTFTQTNAGSFTAGTGLTKNGSEVRVGDGSTGNVGGIARTADDISAAVDNSTVEVSGDVIQVKALGVDTSHMAATSVTAAKLGSDVAGDGLTGGNGADLDVQADAVGGAGLAKVINVSSNGVAVKVDASTVGESGSGKLEIPDGGVTETQLNASVAGNGISGGAGGALALDINGIASAESSPDDADLIAIYDDTAGGLRKMTRANFLSALSVENKKQWMHKITSGETTAGYCTLPETPTNSQSVSVTVVGGPQQVSKQAVGATGVTPDFDIISNTQLHFNNNGAATGLSADLTTDDVLIVEFSY